MKLLASLLSGKELFALCWLIFLIPFARRRFITTLNPVAMIGVGVMLLVLGSLLILPLLNTRFKYHVDALLKQRWTVTLMLAWLLLMAISVYTTKVNQIAGIKVLTMTLTAFVMGALVFAVSHNKENMFMIVHALGTSAFLVIIFALCEIFNLQPFSTWMDTFNEDTTFVDITRISSTFIHPNFMAAYLELTLPLVAVWMLLTSHRILRLFIGFMLFIGLIVLVLSISRGGIFSFSAALFVLGSFAFFTRHRLLALVNLAMLGIIIVAIVVQILAIPRVQVRYLSEGSNDAWYRTVFQVQDTVLAEPGQTLNLSIDVTNTGLFDWETEGNRPVNLGYHVICRDDNTSPSLAGVDMSSLSYLVARGPRTPLPHDVAQGETATLNVSFVAPMAPGQYLVAWDMVQESVTWFSRKGQIPATTALDVAGGEASSTCGTQAYIQDEQPDHPSRLVLWRTALQTIRDNILLGVGASNFNIYYDKYNGEGVNFPHPHNSYLNFLVDFGALSGLLLAVTIFSIGRMLAKAKPSAEDKRGWYTWFAICVALTSFGLHSIVESFNYQPTLFMAFCVIIGITARLR